MRPAEQLRGLVLEDDWTVVEIAARKPNATGGHFSKGYIVQNRDGRRGFLKAMDYTAALEHPDTAGMLLAMTKAYVFERALCEKCNHLSRIAHAIASGSVLTEANNPYMKVEYLVFELADHDIRAHLDAQDALDVTFAMKTLHHVSTGLAQLHRAQIAHQDLKPSNVLLYPSAVGAKICDLGRAWDKELPSPCDGLRIAGDQSYAPIEMLYSEMSTDHRARRFGCDMYHLGSLAVFIFSRVHMNTAIIENLQAEHRPFYWGGAYAEVLPFVQAAFDQALESFCDYVPDLFKDEIRGIVKELCQPDPTRRGLPRNRNGDQYSLERYISRFNHMAHMATIKLRDLT